MIKAILDAFLFILFLALSLFSIRTLLSSDRSRVSNLIAKSLITQEPLGLFLKKEKSKRRPSQHFLFREGHVYSISHRFKGRFDAAIFHWKEVPVLDVLIERKFPGRNVPNSVREPDVFQAALYALALLDSGVSCSSTRLVIIYCSQKHAIKCQNEQSVRFCLSCKHSAVFSRKFSSSATMKKIRELDPYWFEGRNPKPKPDVHKCNICPYGEEELCSWSLAKQKNNH